MVQYFKSLGVALLFSVGICSVGNAASFDCNKATTETEITICADRYLSALDELIASAYFEAKRSRNDKQSLIESQRAWILERDVILQNFSKADEEFLSAQDQLHEILASRLSELLNELTGFDYDTVLNIFNQIEPISLKFEKNKGIPASLANDQIKWEAFYKGSCKFYDTPQFENSYTGNVGAHERCVFNILKFRILYLSSWIGIDSTFGWPAGSIAEVLGDEYGRYMQ